MELRVRCAKRLYLNLMSWPQINKAPQNLDSRVKNLCSSLYISNFYFNLLMFVINKIF